MVRSASPASASLTCRISSRREGVRGRFLVADCVLPQHFAVRREQLLQRFGRIGVKNVKRGVLLLLVHPHIQVCFETNRKSPMRFVKLVGGYTQVGEDAVYRQGLMVPEKLFQVPEVVIDQHQPFIPDPVSQRFIVLVKRDQPSLSSQFL